MFNARVTILSLFLFGSGDIQAAKFDREKWRAQLGPLLEQWTLMTTSSNNNGNVVIVPRGNALAAAGGASGAKKGADAGAGPLVDPVEDFVQMEFALAGELCALVDATLAQLKKVLKSSQSMPDHTISDVEWDAIRGIPSC